MSYPRTLSYKDLVDHCEKLKARLIPYEALKRDYEFYEGLLANFDRIESDLGSRISNDLDEEVPDPKTKKGITYLIVSQHPEGITQEGIIAESAKYGPPLKPGSVSSLLSQLKKERRVKKVGRLFMSIK